MSLNESRRARRPFIAAFAFLGCAAMLPACCMAQASTGEPRHAQVTAVVSAAGGRLYAPGKWGILRVDLSNPRDEPVDLIASTYFVDQPTLQYARQVWVPLRSQMRTWHPALIPEKLSDGGKRAHYR